MRNRSSGRAEPLPDDFELAGDIDRSLRQGLALRDWWETGGPRLSGAPPFPLCTFANKDRSSGLLAEAPVDGGWLPVMGTYLDMLYDRPKIPPGMARPGPWLRSQVREFARRYFLNITSLLPLFNAVIPRGTPPVPPFLRPFSWCPSPQGRSGPAFSPILYKRTGGETGWFPTRPEAPFDSRSIGPRFDWVIGRFEYCDFSFQLSPPEQRLSPPGQVRPVLVIPLQQENVVVLTPDLQVDREDPEPGVTGEYGYGFTYLAGPSSEGRRQIRTGFAQTVFRVHDDGEVRLRHLAIFNQLSHLLDFGPVLDWGRAVADQASFGMASVFLNPWRRAFDQLASGFDPLLRLADFANAVTGGWTERALSLSREDFLKQALMQNTEYLHDFYLRTLQIWEMVPDWCDESSIPAWLLRP